MVFGIFFPHLKNDISSNLVSWFHWGIKEQFHCGKLSMKSLKEAAQDRM